MEAREIDALVAEKIMGWRVDYDSYRHWTDIPGVKAKDLILSEPGYTFHGEKTIEDVPHYSSDIAAAWLVCTHLNNDRTDGAYKRWACFHEALLYKGPVLWGQSPEEAARLICERALEALGIEV